MTSRMKRSQGSPSPVQSEIMARLAAAASGNTGQSSGMAIANGLEFTRLGLVISRELDKDEWSKLFEPIQSIKRSYQWIIGDWMLYGFEHEWVTSYEDMAVFTGLKEKTVKEYTYVCRNIPASIRMDKLSFAHFQLLAPLPDDVREQWIQRSIDEKLSKEALRLALQGQSNPLPPLSKKEMKLLSAFMKSIRHNTLAEIADDDMVLMRKAFDRAEALRKTARR